MINELKWENRNLVVENRQLNSIKAGEECVRQNVNAEIAELWVELNRLKKAKIDDYTRIKKKLLTAYVIVVISWLFFILKDIYLGCLMTSFIFFS